MPSDTIQNLYQKETAFGALSGVAPDSMKPSSDDWSFESKPIGQYGYFFYHEGSPEIPFYWEFGGGDVVLIIRIEEPNKFGLRYPWAVERRREIFERVAQELIA